MIVVLLVATIFCDNSKGQKSSEELKNEQKRIKKDIELLENMMDETASKKMESVSELNLLNQKIEYRNSYIKNLNNEVLNIEKKIIDNKDLINSLNEDLTNIKKEYAEIIYNAYKNRRKENLLMYILASGSFNQAYKRIKYMQLYTEYKNRQARLILAFEKVIVNKNNELIGQQKEKKVLITERESEIINITKEKDQTKRLYKKLIKKEKDLLAEIDEKKKVSRKIETEITKLIEAERRKVSGKKLYEMLTPEERIISNNFESNKGHLPWPTNQGIITGRFGIHEHPVLHNVKIRNDGINISTVRNSDARAVFNGIVSKIFTLPGSNYALIIKHGNYFTLYNNLDEVYVKEGDKVLTKQRIGRIYTDNENNDTVLNFQVWKEMEKNDPEQWLSR